MTSYQLPPEPIGERVARIEVNQDHILETLDKVAAQVKEMSEVMQQAKGGWKVMLWVGTISGAVGAAAVKMFPWLASLPK